MATLPLRLALGLRGLGDRRQEGSSVAESGAAAEAAHLREIMRRRAELGLQATQELRRFSSGLGADLPGPVDPALGTHGITPTR